MSKVPSPNKNAKKRGKFGVTRPALIKLYNSFCTYLQQMQVSSDEHLSFKLQLASKQCMCISRDKSWKDYYLRCAVNT